MCNSIRGATYYGASLHITMALLFLGGFFVDIFGISEVWHNPYATYFSLFLAFIYIFLFLGFGLLIFCGVETESARLLKGSVAGFLVLQISALLVYLALTVFTYSRKTEEEAKNLQMKMFPEFSINGLQPHLKNNFTRSEEVLDHFNDLIKGEVPIITLLQIICLGLGIVVTLLYVAVVVLYVRSIRYARPGRY